VETPVVTDKNKDSKKKSRDRRAAFKNRGSPRKCRKTSSGRRRGIFSKPSGEEPEKKKRKKSNGGV